MGFKTDISFLQKLTMGAIAVRSTMAFLRDRGFAPIELERYCTSNKLWMTKVKRLRVADLLCVNTGLRVEVRAKSDLKIRMSDSPTNPERRWDVGLRDVDLVALVPCEGGSHPKVRGLPVFFAVEDLRATSSLAKLGPPKAPSEGAERDLTWPSIVPTDDGEVLQVTSEQIKVQMRSGRQQTYRLQGKHSYVVSGSRFVGGGSILAGAVPRTIDPSTLVDLRWHPDVDLKLPNAADRFAAAKAIGNRDSDQPGGARVLEEALDVESDFRTQLELAGSLARLGSERGYSFLNDAIFGVGHESLGFLKMEAVLILSEIPQGLSAEILDAVASSSAFCGDELRQAAVWGLGKTGLRDYERVARYIADEENDVALHAIAALDSTAPIAVISALVDLLVDAHEPRVCAAASEALRLIGSYDVVDALVAIAESSQHPWVLATLGRLDGSLLAKASLSDRLTEIVAPVRLLSASENWLAAPSTATDLQFLLQQDL